MGINSTNVAYGFGQMGSGHLKAVATDFFAPKGKVIVAIAMLENVLFDKLLGDTSHQTGSASVDEGPSDTAYFGTGTQIAANGGDGEAGGYNQALSAAVAATVSFPAGLTIYGRWTNISLQGSDYTHGIIVYYGQ
jgi:hypothetical protein|tara:strand:- start:1284 stop:1688 length:405 start_codon:yes stop_codon:yes gene_type:complete